MGSPVQFQLNQLGNQKNYTVHLLLRFEIDDSDYEWFLNRLTHDRDYESTPRFAYTIILESQSD